MIADPGLAAERYATQAMARGLFEGWRLNNTRGQVSQRRDATWIIDSLGDRIVFGWPEPGMPEAAFVGVWPTEAPWMLATRWRRLMIDAEASLLIWVAAPCAAIDIASPDLPSLSVAGPVSAPTCERLLAETGHRLGLRGVWWSQDGEGVPVLEGWTGRPVDRIPVVRAVPGQPWVTQDERTAHHDPWTGIVDRWQSSVGTHPVRPVGLAPPVPAEYQDLLSGRDGFA